VPDSHDSSSIFPPSFRMTETATSDAGVRLALYGELDIAVAEPLRECLARLHQDGVPVTVDLSAVEFMDSSGLSVLIEALRNSRRDGDQLTVAPEISRQVARLLDVASVGRMLWPAAALRADSADPDLGTS
jgi:anti-sigma B factor antagonist